MTLKTGKPGLARHTWLAFVPLVTGFQDVSDRPKPLTVVAQARPMSCYVGQTVELSVGVVVGGERPELTPPKIDGADILFVKTERVPMSVSAVGDVVREQALVRFRYRIVPRRSGALMLPKFKAEWNGRTGFSDPVRLSVQDVPHSGRPSSFLGSVGRFEVEASAEPTTVRSGQTVEYRLRVSGPGARGVTAAPAFDRLSRVPLGLEVSAQPDVTEDEPPSRTFVLRLRTTRAGDAILPPVAVTGFDPVSGRFQTKVAAGIPLRVVDVPRFDPSIIRYEPNGPTQEETAVPLLPALTSLGVVGMFAFATFRAVHRHRSPETAARRVARRLSSRLERLDADAAGRAITDGLADYLRVGRGRPPGALTPDEAAAGVADVTGDNELASRARDLVARCDRDRFGAGDAGTGLIGDGRAFFATLARAAVGAR